MAANVRPIVDAHNVAQPLPYPDRNDFSSRKTLIVFVIMGACFAVLWPKVLQPIIFGGSYSTNLHGSTKDAECCDVITDVDVSTLKILQGLCDKQRNLKECEQDIKKNCGIDVGAALAQIRWNRHDLKQILSDVRSLNGSMCLKYHYGVDPWRLGIPHRGAHPFQSNSHLRQERPMYLRTEMIHPAFKERGRAIPHTSPAQIFESVKQSSKNIEYKTAASMRPTIGGPGHMVPPPKQSYGSISILMPLYTIAIVAFFTYTLLKIVCRKPSTNRGGTEYPAATENLHFRKEVFKSENQNVETMRNGSKPQMNGRDHTKSASKLGEIELERLRRRLRDTELAMERIVNEMSQVPLKSQKLLQANGLGGAHTNYERNGGLSPKVTVMGMETTTSCESGHKIPKSDPVFDSGLRNRHNTTFTSHGSHFPVANNTAPHCAQIFLDRTLPAESQLLVAESVAIEEPAHHTNIPTVTRQSTSQSNSNSDDSNDDTDDVDEPIVLAGKMTLSVVSSETDDDDRRTADHCSLATGHTCTQDDEFANKILTCSEIEPSLLSLSENSHAVSHMAPAESANNVEAVQQFPRDADVTQEQSQEICVPSEQEEDASARTNEMIEDELDRQIRIQERLLDEFIERDEQASRHTVGSNGIANVDENGDSHMDDELMIEEVVVRDELTDQVEQRIEVEGDEEEDHQHEDANEQEEVESTDDHVDEDEGVLEEQMDEEQGEEEEEEVVEIYEEEEVEEYDEEVEEEEIEIVYEDGSTSDADEDNEVGPHLVNGLWGYQPNGTSSHINNDHLPEEDSISADQNMGNGQLLNRLPDT